MGFQTPVHQAADCGWPNDPVIVLGVDFFGIYFLYLVKISFLLEEKNVTSKVHYKYLAGLLGI